jgi:branched-chain amino acid transport system permease protein
VHTAPIIDMQLTFLLEQVVNGLVLGGYYLLLALGLSLIFSVGGIVNLAHGAFYALGAYLALEISNRLGFAASIIIAPALVGLLGIAFERLLLRRFYSADPILSLLVTFGLAMVAEQTLRMIWGAAPLAYGMPPAFKGNVIVGDFLFSRYRLFLLAVVVVVMTALWLLLHKTSFGRVVRAGVQRPDMVAALGIRLQPYMTAIVVLGVATAALGGVLFGPIAVVHPAMGTEIMTVAFVVVVIGGLGSFWGVVLAALLVGVVRGITIHFAPAAGEASMYVLMFLVLMFRPRGLLGERIERFE